MPSGINCNNHCYDGEETTEENKTHQNTSCVYMAPNNQNFIIGNEVNGTVEILGL